MPAPNATEWVATLRVEEQAKRSTEALRLESEAAPIDPARVYGELRSRLARDAIVIGDGGDFVSYAGKYIDTYTPGCFLGPGPYGCLGTGTGYALAAALAHPERQVVVCYGDGAIGFTLGDLDSLVRHGVNVTAVIGNNGIWGLEKHPMQMIFGYDVVAELRPGTRYDEVASALGGHGELVDEAEWDRSGARPRLRARRALGGERAHRSGGRLPPLVEPGLTSRSDGDACAAPRGRDVACPSLPEVAGAGLPVAAFFAHRQVEAPRRARAARIHEDLDRRAVAVAVDARARSR